MGNPRKRKSGGQAAQARKARLLLEKRALAKLEAMRKDREERRPAIHAMMKRVAALNAERDAQGETRIHVDPAWTTVKLTDDELFALLARNARRAKRSKRR